MKKKKEHRHEWDMGLDTCPNCGYYEEYCKRPDCDAHRLCDPRGKCERQDQP